MSELRHDESWAPYGEPGPTESSLAAEAVAGLEPPQLRVVPDLPRPLGGGLLGEEGDVDQELVLRRRLRVTPDVVTLVLEPTVPRPFAFRPGQFLTLVVDVEGTPVERCYTISSPPTRPHLLTVTVKKMPGGALSPYLHDTMPVGARLHARGPHGVFSVSEHPAARYLLLSAGSGVTPTLATVRALADLGELGAAGAVEESSAGGTDVVVVHAARTPADRVCAAELEALAAAHDGLRVVWVCEHDDPAAPGAWSGHRGRLSADLLREVVGDLHEREVLTCGPPGFMDAARRLLVDLGVAPSRCHEESFVLGSPAAPLVPPGPQECSETLGDALEAAPELVPPEPLPGAPELVAPELVASQPVTPEPVTATVRFGRSGLEVACAPGTTVLQAAAQAGVALPSSCSAGLCGTCKSTLLSGRVEMKHQGGIRPREVAQDKFLPCCSTPDGDIVVDA